MTQLRPALNTAILRAPGLFTLAVRHSPGWGIVTTMPHEA